MEGPDGLCESVKELHSTPVEGGIQIREAEPEPPHDTPITHGQDKSLTSYALLLQML